MRGINSSTGKGVSQDFDNYQNPYDSPRNPNGWYAVCVGSELKKGMLKKLSYFGKELIAFRDEHGVACVADAYCPHMGAHLGEGGKIINGHVQCPLHGWTFNGQGRCTIAPFSTQTPQGQRTKLNTYLTEEVNGAVMIWYHIKNSVPTYHIPEIEEMNLKKWMPMQNFSRIFRTHVQEIRENFCDESHFAFIHQQEGPAQIDWETDGPLAYHKSQLTWKYFIKMGLTSEKYNFRCDSIFYGPGVLVTRLRGLIDSTTIAFATPIDDSYTAFTLLGTSRKIFPGLNWINRRSLIKTAKRDVQLEGRIWSNKKNYNRPIYQPHERSMKKFRHWYQQFYDGQ